MSGHGDAGRGAGPLAAEVPVLVSASAAAVRALTSRLDALGRADVGIAALFERIDAGS